MTVFYHVLFALWGFLFGSILFCKWIPKWVKKIDVCAVSKDGNPGTANVFVHCGVPLGMVCLLLELFKGFAPTFAATMLLGSDHPFFVLVVIAPALGHAVAPFDRFKGGKCIAVIFGVLLGTVTETWTGWILVGLYIFFFAVVRLKPNRVCSIVTYSLFAVIAPTILFFHGKPFLATGYFLLAVIALVRHLRAPR